MLPNEPPWNINRNSSSSGQLQCLHGQHQVRIAKELLLPHDYWWTFNIYLEGKMLSPNQVAIKSLPSIQRRDQ
jgi:hypothetical protein